jgi:hypothetical protein
LPPIQLRGMSILAVLTHVILITIVSNIGKCVPMMAYRDEVTLRERLALSVGMFPRGEVGIGVLLVSLEIFRQLNILELPAVQQSMTIGALSLALNLVLTGVFITVVIPLVRKPTALRHKSTPQQVYHRVEKRICMGLWGLAFLINKMELIYNVYDTPWRLPSRP